MSVLDDLIEKLEAAGVTVYKGPPGRAIEPPAVVLAPGSPDWWVPETFGTVREAWRVSAAVTPGEDIWAAIQKLRALNRQVFDAAGASGALWLNASPPALTEIQGVSFLASTHRLTIPLEEEEEL